MDTIDELDLVGAVCKIAQRRAFVKGLARVLHWGMRTVFMGTPEFAVPVLTKLVQAGFEVAAAVTQPDRPAGRSGLPLPPPVKAAALTLGLSVLQPSRMREPGVVAELRRLAPDLIVVAAFGQILPRDVLAIPRHGCLNVHASLLPKYRGAAPIAAAILNGERETGITIMQMEPGLDTGPILAQRSEPIREDDTTASLGARLAELGADLLVEVLPRWIAGEIRPRPQDESGACYAPQLRREQGHIGWHQTAVYIARQCRAYFPWPGCYSHWNNQAIKFLSVWATELDSPACPGEVILGPGGGILVATGHGALAVERLQLAGKRPMSGEEFLRGQRHIVGAVLK